jgi:adenylate cyclase
MGNVAATKRIPWGAIGLAFIATLIHGIVYFSPLGAKVEHYVADAWFTARGKIDSPGSVAIVAIDEQSYRNLNVPLNQPWPRALEAKLLAKLKNYDVKGVVFDILFLDQGSDPAADRALAESIAGIPVYLGAESSVQQVRAATGSYVLEELLTPYPPFKDAAKGIALVGLPEDAGVIRRFFTARSEQTAHIPSLAEAGYLLYSGASAAPQAPSERDFIKYYGPARSIPSYSFYQLLEEEKPLPKEVLQGRVVYVGLVLRTDTGPAQKDVFSSPFLGERIFGTEIHATGAANLIEQNWIKRWGEWTELLFLSVIGFAVFAGIAILRPGWGVIISLTSIVLWLVSSFLLFLGSIFLPGLLLMGGFIPLFLLGASLFKYQSERKSSLRIQNAFERYLSPEMARQMAEQPGALELGGQKIWATALFTDIADFSTISEEMPAEKVAEMLNAYFSEVLEIVFENKGTLIKFIGDAAFVLWGAPMRIDNHAELALKSAMGMHLAVKKFNETKRFPALNTRLGIHTGPMVVGNLGSARRFDYTAIGDSVNLASRIEGLNKYFGTTILFSSSTRKDLGSAVKAISVGFVQVAGKKEPVELYMPYGDEVSEKQLNYWEEGCRSFKGKQWTEARESFERLLGHELLGKPAELYLKEIKKFESAPPPGEWRGELIFSSK